MLCTAGQTAGPIKLKICLDTHGWPGGVIGYKKLDFFSKFFSRATPGPSAKY